MWSETFREDEDGARKNKLHGKREEGTELQSKYFLQSESCKRRRNTGENEEKE